MSITFFCVGAVIFTVYMYFTVWNIYNAPKKLKRIDYPNLGGEGCNLPPQSVQMEVKRSRSTRKTRVKEKLSKLNLS